MKKFKILLAALLCVGALCACGEVEQNEQVGDTVDILKVDADTTELTAIDAPRETQAQDTTTAPTETTEGTADINTDSSDAYNLEPPLTEAELTMPVPDFLNEEQQLLYRRAQNVYTHLFGPVTFSVEYHETLNYRFSEYTYDTNEFGWRYHHSQGRYQDWDDFMDLVLSVFTEEFFNEKNIDRFIERDGKLTFLDVARGGTQYYNPNFQDEFELISKSDTEICFYVIGHYSQIRPYNDESFEERDRRVAEGWELTDKFIIRMVNTDSGWRFDEFHETRVDERTDLISQLLSKEDAKNSQIIEKLTISPTMAEKSANELSDAELIGIFKQLIENYKKYLNIYFSYGLQFDYDDIYDIGDERIKYCRVLNIDSMDELKEMIGNVFSRQIREDLIYPMLVSHPSSPLFTEHEGKLYYNVDTGGDYPFHINLDTATVLERGENGFSIGVTISEISRDFEKAYKISQEDNKWVISYDFYLFNDF